MDPNRAQMIAVDLLRHHGLEQQGWRFGWMRATRTMGLCNERVKLISISKPLTLLNSEDLVLNTILHEIAHALAGWRARHDMTWKLMAKSIGCTGERCVSPDIIQVKTDWQCTCKDCGQQGYYTRRPKTGIILLGVHRPCKRKANKGALAWTFKGSPYSVY